MDGIGLSLISRFTNHTRILLGCFGRLYEQVQLRFNKHHLTIMRIYLVFLVSLVTVSQQLAIRLPDSLPIFELLVLATDEFPQLCVGVRDCSNDKPPTGQQLRFDIIELNGAPVPVPGRTVSEFLC